VRSKSEWQQGHQPQPRAEGIGGQALYSIGPHPGPCRLAGRRRNGPTPGPGHQRCRHHRRGAVRRTDVSTNPRPIPASEPAAGSPITSPIPRPVRKPPIVAPIPRNGCSLSSGILTPFRLNRILKGRPRDSATKQSAGGSRLGRRRLRSAQEPRSPCRPVSEPDFTHVPQLGVRPQRSGCPAAPTRSPSSSPRGP